jgi:1-acyl-sn-glycerol-3-phosphate acyltransferase
MLNLFYFLRSFLHMLVMASTVLVYATVLIACAPFASPERLYGIAKAWLALSMHSLRLICGVRWRVTGLEHLPQNQASAAILLCKHQSTLETFLMPVIMPNALAYVFKKELLYVPFFGWAIGLVDMIHIDRSKRQEAFAKVVSQGQRLLNKRVWVIMFPEGTRIDRGQQGQYKTGGTRLAVATGAPVVPIAVNSARCWAKRAFIKRPGVVDVVIGKPIPSQGRTPEDLMSEVASCIEAEMRRIDAPAYP